MPATRTLLTSVLVLALAATACSNPVSSGPDPKPVAAALATALASGDFSGVTFAAGTSAGVTKDYAAVVAGLGDTTDPGSSPVVPTVSVSGVDQDGDAATVSLAWSWPLGSTPWTYTSTAMLTRSGSAWAVDWAPSLVSTGLTTGDQLVVSARAAKRGDILGPGGAKIVEDRSVITFGIDRTRVGASGAAASARALAALVDIDPAAYVKEVGGSGPKAFVEAITYRFGQIPTSVLRGYTAIKGAIRVSDRLPLGPTKGFAAPILGSVGEVTAEMIKDHPDTYRAGDVAGLSGLEERYDDKLRGTPGYEVTLEHPQRVPSGRPRVARSYAATTLTTVEPIPGKPLRVTLDTHLQTVAERLLGSVGPASAIVAIRPSTGAILAAANGPGADGYDIATYGQYAPGSTFKSVSSLALLRDGLTPDTVVPCTTSITVDGKVFTNDSDYPPSAIGSIPLSSAIANSCNTAYISQASKVTGTGLFDAAASLGMGLDHDVGFPAYFGSVTQPSTDTERAADMIGQGTILASPMTMATVIASVQQGSLVVPHLVDGITAAPPDGAAPITAAQDAQLRSMLRGVVTSGTGRVLLDLPGPPVIAKTGTAEFERGGKTLTHAWMIAAQGDLAVAVFVDVGQTGAGTAGPILAAFLRAARGSS